MRKEDILKQSDIHFDRLSEEETEQLEIFLDEELKSWEAEKACVKKKEINNKRKRIISLLFFFVLGIGFYWFIYLSDPAIFIMKKQNRELEERITGLKTDETWGFFSENNIESIESELIGLERDITYSILLSNKEDRKKLEDDLREYTKRMNDLIKRIAAVSTQ